jgi:Na+-transporting NADH:ubiquinone oxidoreductase subunit NqrB
MALRNDPRHYQIASLSGLLVYGMGARGFDVTPVRALFLLTACLIAQRSCERLAGLKHFEPRSALVSGLSLCLLLRTSSWPLALLAVVITISSKFLLRVRGKHLFNPTNFGIVTLMASTGAVWASPGQWGSAVELAFLIACLGGLVVNRAARSDVSFAFLLSWAALLFSRAAWLGDPWAIPLHQLGGGALLLFAFFMISDPKTTPDSRAGRVVFALLVAAGAYYVQFKLFRPNGLLWSLAAASLFVPLIDRLLPGPRYDWSRPRSEEGRRHAPSLAAVPAAVPSLAAPA